MPQLFCNPHLTGLATSASQNRAQKLAPGMWNGRKSSDKAECRNLLSVSTQFLFEALRVQNTELQKIQHPQQGMYYKHENESLENTLSN